MQLISINTGAVQVIDYHESKVSTGIFKKPVTGPVQVKTLGMEGDQQADLSVHGGINKAVYLYPSEHFSFWRDQYPDREFGPGVFGENLTTRGLIESQINVGDTLSIGPAEFMVTLPRMPCFKLGIKMGDPRFMKAFLQANRTGFYLKVITEGVIEAGQPIALIGSDGFGLKVEEISRLYGQDKDNQELLKKAVEAPNLTRDWKDYFQKRLDGSAA